MQVSISAGNMKIGVPDRPLAVGQLAIFTGIHELQFVLQVTETQCATFSLDPSSARVLIAAIDQEALSLERSAQHRRQLEVVRESKE